ncbi:MAG: ParB/RepB/Spo0J family partition protein, partial [Clostridia bacterium]|nr:ParB/RepB/Spo0J family partition protein [Clostridia bacterium]
MPKNKGLGKGLDAIFRDNLFAEDETTTNERLIVPISQLDTNPDQPRKSFDSEALAGLADSISANGLLQPILVRMVSGRYEIIAGE